MRKTANSLDHTKLNHLHSNPSNQPYKKGIATFHSYMPLNQKGNITPCREQIFEQVCSTTFTSKIFQFSNCESKGSSNAISPAKSQKQMQNRKKKINVTTSIIKMKTEATEPSNHKFSPNIHPLNQKDEREKTTKIQCSTNEHNKKGVSAINPQKGFDQILKKLGGKKTSEIKYPFTNQFSPNLKAKLNTQVIEKTEQKDYESSISHRFKLKENCSILRSQKKISHLKKTNLQLDGDFTQRKIKRIETQTWQKDGIWIALRQNTEFCSEDNMANLNDTPINRLFEEEEQEMFFRKPKFFCDK